MRFSISLSMTFSLYIARIARKHALTAYQPSLAPVWSLVWGSFFGLILMLGLSDLSLAQAQVESPSAMTLDSDDIGKGDGIGKGDDSVPQQELSADLLSELLVLNLALYEDQWELGLAHTKKAALSSKDPRLAKAAAVLAVQNKDFKSSLEMAEFWLQLQPDAEDGFDILILSQINQGLVEQAMQGLHDKGALSEPNVDKSIRKLAGLVVQQDNSYSGLALIEQILLLHPNSAQVHLSSAYVAAAFGDARLATEWLDRALELKPGWESAALSKVELIVGPAQTQTRTAFLRDYLSEYPQSIAMRTLFAAELASAGKLDNALLEVQKVLNIDARNVQALTYAAVISIQLGDIKNAKKYYRRVNDIDPHNEDALLALAQVAEREQKYVTAKKYYGQVASDKNYLYAQIRLAFIAAEEERVDDAVELLGLLEPSNEQEFLEIALTRHFALLQDQRLEEALGYMNDSLMYLPDDLALLYARGLAAAEMRDIKLAEADFTRVLELNSEHVDALNAFGYTLADQTDRYQEAEKLIAKAMALRPDSAHIMDSYGWVMFRKGDLDVARDYLSRALELSDEVEISLHLAEVLWAMGAREQARELLLAVKSQQSDSLLLEATIERLGVDLNDL